MKKNILITATVRSGHNFVRNQIESWDKNDNFLIGNFEDCLPENHEKMKKQIAVGGKPINEEHSFVNIVVTRDLLNWLASYLKWIVRPDMPVDREKFARAIDIWKAMTWEAFKVTDYLPEKYHIVYDDFKRVQGIRKWLCYAIEGSYTEDQLDFIPEAGGGSSFDKRDVKGTELRTDLRWQQIFETSLSDLYIDLLRADRVAINLYRRHFNTTEEQRKFITSL